MLEGKQGGQSMVEMVFAVGILGLVLSGAMMLLIKSMAVKGTSFERKKAVELGTAVMEELVAAQKNNPEIFWRLENIPPGTMLESPAGIRSGYPGYTYAIGFTNVAGMGNCGAGGAVNCVQVNVRVGWTADTIKSVEFSKFMTRQ